MRKFLFLGLLISFTYTSAQSLAVGAWRDHLSYKSATDVCQVGEKIYVSTDKALFVYDTSDHSVERVNTLNGLSDSGVSSIASSDNSLIVAYENGNIDLIQEGKITNIPDVKRASLIGGKRINHISIYDQTAYLSCGFGIIDLNLDKKEIRATYFIGPQGSHLNITATSVLNSKIYAASESSLYSASMENGNLADFNVWEKVVTPSLEKISLMTSFNNLLFLNFQGASYNTDRLYSFDGVHWDLFDKENSNVSLKVSEELLVIGRRFEVSVFDEQLNQVHYLSSSDFGEAKTDFNACLFNQGKYWVADQIQGLLYAHQGSTERILPEGPYHSEVTQIKNLGDEIWLSHGAVSENWDPTWKSREVSVLKSDTWTTSINLAEMGLKDLVAVNQNKGKTYVASWQRGLAKINNGSVEVIYDETNSSLQKRAVYEDWMEVGDIQFDRQGNLWCTNSQTRAPLSVMYSNGEWESFSLENGISEHQDLSKLMIDRNDRKWVQLKNNGIIVFDERRAENKTRMITNGEKTGNLASDRVFSLVEDLKGDVWVGTDNGLSVFYSAEDIFEGENASKIKVTSEGYTTYLLEGQQINDIAVDGGNRKWFALNNNGVILTSANGTEQIHHFTTANSPLFSNKVLDVEVNEATGEVFFATDKGLISFRGEATKGQSSFSEVLVFPNPVKPDYEGLITIKGLMTDAVVKITDISGNLIYETQAIGGQATWDGRSFEGAKAQTGVYLIFCSDDDGNATRVAKLLFVRG